MKLNVCQVLKCKKLESPDHPYTLCERHFKILEKYQKQRGFDNSPFEYKSINEKNNVWDNGVENVRSIPTSQINLWLKHQKEKKETFEKMLAVIQEQIDNNNEKITDLERTKNMRFRR
jgi:hypothetical protein